MVRLFISHSSEDKDKIVRPLVDSLEKHNIRTWYDEKDILDGDSISQAVFRGLKSSHFVILIITPNVWKSNWVWLESGGYLLKQRPVIPVLWGVTHDQFASRFPFLAEKKYISADTKDSDYGICKVTTRLQERVQQYRTENLIGESCIEISEIITRLHRYSIEKSSELVSFIRRYEQNRYDPENAYVWMKRIVDLVVRDILKDKTSAPDSVSLNNLNRHNCPCLTDIIIEHFKFFDDV